MLRHANCDNVAVLLHMLEVLDVVGLEIQSPESRKLLQYQVTLIQAESRIGALIEADRQGIELSAKTLDTKLRAVGGV